MRKLLELNLKLLLFARSARFRTTVGRRGGLPRQYKKLGIESVPGVRYPKVTRIQNIPNKPSIYEVVRFYGGKIYVAHYFSGPAPGVGERDGAGMQYRVRYGTLGSFVGGSQSN